MKRLTRPSVTPNKLRGFQYEIECTNDKYLDHILNGPVAKLPNKFVLRGILRQLYARLKLYEDMELQPDDLDWINSACADGRLWILPAVPGDDRVTWYWIEDDEICSDTVWEYHIGPNCDGEIVCLTEGHVGMCVNLEDIGKTVFFDEALAIAALDAMNKEESHDE